MNSKLSASFGAWLGSSAEIRPVEGEMAPDRRFRARRDDESMQSIGEEEQRSHGASGQARSPSTGMDLALGSVFKTRPGITDEVY